MTSLLANRAARRRGIAYTVLLAVTLLLMAFSSNPGVRELQNGIGFAFRPIQGALDQIAGGIASIGSGDHRDRPLCGSTTRPFATRTRASPTRTRGSEEIKRENDQLTALLQLKSGFDFETTAASVIGREPSEFRRLITLDKGTDDGLAEGDVVIAAGGALAGRITEIGPGSSTVVLLTDAESTVIGQLASNAATGEVVGQLGGVLVMNQIDSSAQVGLNDEVLTAGITLASGIRSPYPKGLLIGQVVDVRRDANDVVQTAFLQPTADLDRLEYVLVILDYEGGLPPIEQQPVDCSGGDTLPVGEQPCYTPTPEPRATAPTPKP